MTTQTTFRKAITAAVAFAMLGTATLSTFDSAQAGNWQHRNHGHHGYHDNGTAFAIGAGIALFGAIMQNAQRNADPRPRCRQAKEWIKLALAAERMADRDEARGDHRGAKFMRAEARRRWAKSKRARRDCNEWYRN